MLVFQNAFKGVIERLSTPGVRAFDTETTGLRPWQGDRLFSLIIADQNDSFYFNFQEYEGLDPNWILPRELLQDLRPVFENPESKWYAHNAKFDMGMLAAEGLHIGGTIHCTEALGRVLNNQLFTYKLDALASSIGHKKDDAVKEAIKKMKLYKEEWSEEQGKKVKIPQFHKVPFRIISQYGMQDGRITLELGMHQTRQLQKMAAQIPMGKERISKIVANEYEVTKVFFEMERLGIRVDGDFSARAASHEQARMAAVKREWFAKTGEEFVDSAVKFAPIFTAAGEIYPTTEKGNPSFTDDVLEGMKSPLAKLIQEFRDARKRCNTYYKNFIKFSDSSGILHAGMRQGGTATGRISYADPNLQNLTKEEADGSSEFLIRRAFVPREGRCFGMIDFDQMEYRLMLEYAKEQSVIDQVLAGLDVHEATAKMMSTPDRKISRSEAKTLNFMLLYGGGVAKLAMALFPTLLPERELKIVHKFQWARGTRAHKITSEERATYDSLPKDAVDNDIAQLEKAQALREIYFDKLPRVREFTSDVISKAQERGYIVNWAGRVCQFPISGAAYKAPNYLIQGGCADAMKIAMVKIHKFLEKRQSKMLVQIHDELLFEMHPAELDLLHELKRIMESVYPYKQLPLTCGVEHSWKSWADKMEGIPNVENGRYP